MSVDEIIGGQVHQLLWQQRRTQRDLYVEMGVTRFTLSKKLRGQVAWSADDVAIAAEVLGCTPNDLYQWAPSDSNRQPTDSRSPLLWLVAA